MTDPDSHQADAPAQSREAYYAEARSWAADREEAQRRTYRTAWIISAIATGIAALEALALIALAPLKTVVPYTVMVDRTTGFTQVVDGTHPQVLKPQAALTQSLLAQYVIARETFDITSVADQYRKVGLWSAEDARRDYLALMPAGNPQSPLNIYPRSALVTASVESVSNIGPQTAQVRFVTERRDQPQGAVTRNWWVAELRYRFAGEPMAYEDQLINPLGFQVVHYRRDQETAPQATGAAGGVFSQNVAPAAGVPGSLPAYGPAAGFAGPASGNGPGSYSGQIAPQPQRRPGPAAGGM